MTAGSINVTFTCDAISEISSLYAGGIIPDGAAIFNFTDQTISVQRGGVLTQFPAAISPPVVNSPNFANVTSAQRLSTIRGSRCVYELPASISTLLANQSVRATLKYADDSGMTTNVVTAASDFISGSGLIGLNGGAGLVIDGYVPANKYRQLTFTTVGGASAPTALDSSQEVVG